MKPLNDIVNTRTSSIETLHREWNLSPKGELLGNLIMDSFTTAFLDFSCIKRRMTLMAHVSINISFSVLQSSLRTKQQLDITHLLLLKVSTLASRTVLAIEVSGRE